MSNWINYKESHPKEEGQYLTFCSDGKYRLSRYSNYDEKKGDGFGRLTTRGFKQSTVLFWMLLPKPPVDTERDKLLFDLQCAERRIAQIKEKICRLEEG